MALNAVDRVKYDHKSIGMFKCVCMVIGLGIGIIILEDLRFGHYVVEPFLEFFERVCRVINKLLLLFSDWNYLRTKQTKRIAYKFRTMRRDGQMSNNFVSMQKVKKMRVLAGMERR